MSQLNIHLTPDFEAALNKLMRVRGLKTKSEAVRLAIQETLERETRVRNTLDFTEWIGLGNRAKPNPHPRFRSHDDLWS